MHNRSSKSWIRIIGALVALSPLVLSGCSGGKKAEADSAGGAPSGGKGGRGALPRVVPVTTATVAKQDVPLWLEGLGSVSAWQQALIRSQVDGVLEKVFFKEGDAVKKDQLLAQIDPRPYAVQLHTAEGSLSKDTSTLADAKLNLERYRSLVQQKLIAQQQVDDQAAAVGQAEGAVVTDKASIESAKLNLNYAAVKSPFDGIVGVRQVDAGNLIHATDTTGLVILTQLDPAAVFVTLPEDDLERVMAAKQRGEVKVEAWSRDGGEKLGEGVVYVIDNQINQQTATLRLKCQVANPANKLWPNQFVKARVLLDTRKGATVIPPTAVQRGPNGTFVYVVKDKKAEQRNITVALSTADVVVIDKGLEPGEQVVIEGQNQLRPGVEVNAHASNVKAVVEGGSDDAAKAQPASDGKHGKGGHGGKHQKSAGDDAKGKE